jgi:hypothetical protein
MIFLDEIDKEEVKDWFKTRAGRKQSYLNNKEDVETFFGSVEDDLFRLQLDLGDNKTTYVEVSLKDLKKAIKKLEE